MGSGSGTHDLALREMGPIASGNGPDEVVS
jgi:hypothetical protein